MSEQRSLVTAVATLPMHVRPDPFIGEYLAPLVTDLLARYLGSTPVVALNLLGRKARSRDPSEAVAEATTCLNGLGIQPDVLWRDDTEEVRRLAGDALHLLHARGFVTEEIERIFCCPCGAVELPERAMPQRAMRGKVFDADESGTVRCRLCDRTAAPSERSDLYLRFPAVAATAMAAYPAYASAETELLAPSDSGVAWRITRTRSTDVTAELSGRTYNLDVDFVWSLMPTALVREGIEVGTLVTSHRTLAKAVTMIRLNALLGEWTPPRAEILITPYLQDALGARIKGNGYRLHRLAAEYEPRPLRLWMTLGLGWDRKEVRLGTRELYWCLHAVSGLRGRPPSEPSTTPSLAGFLRLVSADTARAGIAEIRKKRTRPDPATAADTVSFVLGTARHQAGDERPGGIVASHGHEAQMRTAPPEQLKAAVIADVRGRLDLARSTLARPAGPEADPEADPIARIAGSMWWSLRDLLRWIDHEQSDWADALTGARARFPDLFSERARHTLRTCLDHIGRERALVHSMPESMKPPFLEGCVEVHETIYAKLLAMSAKELKETTPRPLSSTPLT